MDTLRWVTGSTFGTWILIRHIKIPLASPCSVSKGDDLIEFESIWKSDTRNACYWLYLLLIDDLLPINSKCFLTFVVQGHIIDITFLIFFVGFAYYIFGPISYKNICFAIFLPTCALVFPNSCSMLFIVFELYFVVLLLTSTAVFKLCLQCKK